MQSSRRLDSPLLSMRLVRPFRVLGHEHGLNPDFAWEREGFNVEQLDDMDAYVPMETADKLLRKAVEVTDEPDFGLLAASRTEPGLFDVVEFASRSQATLGAAVDCLCRFLPLLTSAFEVSARPRQRARELACVLRQGVTGHRGNVDFLMAVLQIAARRFTGRPDLCPDEVWFSYAEPETTHRHQEIFRCPLRFGAPYSAFIDPEWQFALPLVHSDPALKDTLERAGERLLEKYPRAASLTEAVSHLVGRQLTSEDLSAASVAKQLGLATRTMHRRLSDEGTTFRLLHDGVRRQVALNYLLEDRLCLSEVAYLCGFSTVQAFHRAFKRWTGQTPRAYRLEQREAARSVRLLASGDG